MIEILITLWVLYTLLFLISIKIKDNSIADVFWGFGFVVIALLSFWGSTQTLAQTLVTLLVTAWGIRLVVNIGAKKLRHSWEDARYAGWRKTWKYFYVRSFFQVYILQWVLMCLVALPIFFTNLTSWYEEFVWVSFVGWVIALFGLLYETIADTELAQFVRTKKSWEILTEWLRKYSRYPQYFGESVFWLGISIIAFQASLVSFVGWIVITILVRYVSGVPMLEKRYQGQKNYEVYSQDTPVFFPNWTK